MFRCRISCTSFLSTTSLLAFNHRCGGKCLTTGSLRKMEEFWLMVCQFPWYKYSCHGWFQAINTASLNTELRRYSQLSQEIMSHMVCTTAFNGIPLVTRNSLPFEVAPPITDPSGLGPQTKVLLPSAVHANRMRLSLVKKSRTCIIGWKNGERCLLPDSERGFGIYRLRCEVIKVFQACEVILLLHSTLLQLVLFAHSTPSPSWVLHSALWSLHLALFVLLSRISFCSWKQAY